jgi:hypothetical protein
MNKAVFMHDTLKHIPSYLTEKGNIVKLIFFTAAFALVFINIYAPFGATSWFKVTQLEFLAYSSLVILTGVLVVVVSRILMHQYSKHNTISYTHYILWILGEVFCMALFYTFFEKIILNEPRNFLDMLKISIQNTALVLLLPYSVLWLYFSWKDKKIQLETLTREQPTDNSKNMVPFNDEKGILRLSVKMENLIYLESSDNYVNIAYLNNGKLTKYMLRNSMKKIEEKFKETSIVRCHRSFMVNFEKIKVIRKEKDGLRLEFDVPQAIDLPVSKTYIDNVMKTFARYSLYE